MIIAVDFDGILCKNKFPDIGPPNFRAISLIQMAIYARHEVILWTCRVGPELEAAVKWCKHYGLHFCAINENAPSNIDKYKDKYPEGTRKVYADVYIDDHNIEYITREKSGQSGYACMLDSMVGLFINNEEE